MWKGVATLTCVTAGKRLEREVWMENGVKATTRANSVLPHTMPWACSCGTAKGYPASVA